MTAESRLGHAASPPSNRSDDEEQSGVVSVGE
jgi:hypothetical protein